MKKPDNWAWMTHREQQEWKKMNGPEACDAQRHFAPVPAVADAATEVMANECCGGRRPHAVAQTNSELHENLVHCLSEKRSSFSDRNSTEVPCCVDDGDLSNGVDMGRVPAGDRSAERVAETAGRRHFPGASGESENVGGCAEVQTILDEAARITSLDRNKTYGPPRDNHSRTAALWQAYLSGLNGRPLDYRDVCWLNVLQKASRDVFCRGRDCIVDGAGFLRNIEMADNDEGR